MAEKAHLYYATDTYCIWCWGFGPSLREFAKRHADDAAIEVVFGGLLTGDRVVPIGEKPRAKEGAVRVGELCGVQFGDGFFAAVEEGTTVLDSMIAARAFVSLRELLGVEQGLEIAHSLQHAWYFDGQDLHDEQVLRQIAANLGADPDAFWELFSSERSTQLAEADFQRRKDLQIKGYPSLLLETPDGLKQVGGPTSSPERLDHVFERLMAGEVPDHDPDEDDDED